MSTEYLLPQSFRNYREQNDSQESSQESTPEGSQEGSQEGSPQLPEEESIMYVIYCHGEMMPNLFDNFVIPQYLDRTIHLYYLVDVGYILWGVPNNISEICNANIDPTHSKRSNDIISIT